MYKAKGAEMNLWHLWVIIGIALLILEIFTPGFIVACLGVAFLVVSIPAFFGWDIKSQIVVFSAANLVIFFYIRPFFLKFLSPNKPEVRTNTDALIGKIGIVSQEIDPQTFSGRVNVGGEDWRAVSANERPINIGEKVVVKKVENTKLFVEPV